MSESNIIDRSFKPWKIWLAIGIGLTIITLLLFRSINESHFVEVDKNTGDFSWIDGNKNGKVDLKKSIDFEYTPGQGSFNKVEVRSLLKSLHWDGQTILFLFIAMLLMVGRDFFYIVRIRQLTHNELTWKASTYVILIWEFASAVSPGVVGGAAVAMFILNKEKIALGRSTAIVFITALMDNLFYVLMIPIVFLFINNRDLFPDSESSTSTLFWSGYILVFTVTSFLFLSVFKYPKLASGFLKGVFSLPFLKRWKSKAIETGNEIEITSSEMRKEPFSYWIKVFFSTMGSWTCRYLVINAIFQAFIGFGLFDHVSILMKQFILWLFMLVSPTPGGSGVAEYAFTEMFSGFASSTLLLLTIAIVWRLISYFPYLFIGAFLLPRWLNRTRN